MGEVVDPLVGDNNAAVANDGEVCLREVECSLLVYTTAYFLTKFIDFTNSFFEKPWLIF